MPWTSRRTHVPIDAVVEITQPKQVVKLLGQAQGAVTTQVHATVDLPHIVVSLVHAAGPCSQVRANERDGGVVQQGHGHTARTLVARHVGDARGDRVRVHLQ